jgi:glycosyltransferase involved in cell wall biosynthesis
MPINFTVAIRTYNAEKRLPEVLDRLLTQINTENIHWEVLVIDNNSTDQTAAVVAEYAQRWRPDSQIRYLSEPRQGVGYGRELAMREAASEALVGFLDDDNLPEQTWLATAYRFGQQHPNAGAYGGNIYPKLDTPSPDDFHRIQFLLAINDSGSASFRYPRTFIGRRSPINPGCVIRKQAWQEAVPQSRRLWGRDESQRSMATCAEDVEVFHYIINSRWEVWHNGDMQVWHHMPARRLEPEYLLRMARKSGLSAHALRLSRLHPWQQPLLMALSPMFILWGGLRVILFYLRYGNQLATDIVKACLFQRQIGIFLSCFATPRSRRYDESPSHPRATQTT